MSGRPKWVRRFGAWLRDYVPVDGRLSYSHEGEDLTLARILGEKDSAPGFFVDIGAHHPTRFSNTYYFYRRGWRGINVDAMPGTKKLFRRLRPRDITVECGVGSKKGVLKYFSFNESALNTFSEQEARKKDVPPYRILNTLEIPVVTLKEILDEYLPSGTRIDFLNIDAEGFDYEIISSNDWGIYRPRVVLVELLNTEIKDLETNPTAQALYKNDYRVLAKTISNVLFVANEHIPGIA